MSIWVRGSKWASMSVLAAAVAGAGAMASTSGEGLAIPESAAAISAPESVDIIVPAEPPAAPMFEVVAPQIDAAPAPVIVEAPVVDAPSLAEAPAKPALSLLSAALRDALAAAPATAMRVNPGQTPAAGWRREVENYLDMSHFAFAHSATLGKAADPRIPDMDIKLHDDGFQMDAPFPALESAHEMPGKLQSAHHRRQRCYLPNFTTIRQSFTDGDERVLLHVPSPRTRTSCTVFWSLAISPGFDGPPPATQLEFAVRVLDEDRLMCENQIPAEVPINPGRGGWGVLVMPGDTLANTFQKQLDRKSVV